MLVNYFKIAFRHLQHNKLLAFINIAGLTLGIACALLAILYVTDEMSYDRFHQKSKQIYRLTTTITNSRDGSQQTLGTTGQVQGPAFKAAVPEIEDYTRILGMDGINITSGSKSLAVKNLYVDESFFDLFSFSLLRGNPKTALRDPFSIVLSEATSLKVFNTTDVIGKTFKIEEGRGIDILTVTGVARNAPANSSIQFDILVPFKYFQLMFKDENWLNNYLTTFFLLHSSANPEIISRKLTREFQTKAKKQSSETGIPPDQYQFRLLPATDMHLNPMGLLPYGTADEEQGLSGGSTITYSYILTGIVAFILLMACVNFVNLSIAGSLKRAREIGIRKIAGSTKGQIVKQFLIEAAILCCISYILAILLSSFLLPIFNQLSGKKIFFSHFINPGLFLDGIILMLFCIFIAGVYPAVVLSLYNPAKVLYNKQKLTQKHFFGKTLIIIQFTLAVGLVIATIVYYGQMNFISNEDLGYNSSGMIKIHLPPQRIQENTIQVLRNQLVQAPTIKEVTSEEGMGENVASVNGHEFNTERKNIDEFYLPTLAISMKNGRNFSNMDGRDSSNPVIVNEAFVKSAGWENPIGQQFTNLDDRRTMTVIGVIKDYHYGSLKEKIGPQVLSLGNREFVIIKIQTGKIAQALPVIEMTFKKTFPQHYFNYTFLDDEISRAYHSDRNWQQIITFSAGLAIFICMVGLFGLSSFAAQQRIKEIGVRKVLGASVAAIAGLLVKDFLELVLVAIILASPIAWYIMNRWLQDFAYHINISWWVFALAGLAALLIAFITVSFKAMKAALANPVESLRSD